MYAIRSYYAIRRTASRPASVSRLSKTVGRFALRSSPAKSSTSKGAGQMAARLREHYDNVVRKEMQEKFGYANPMMIPKLTKIVLNMSYNFV